MTTDLALITDGGADIVAMFKDGGAQIDPILARIEAEVRSHAPDVTTDKGRKAIASLAYKVSQSKTALDNAGKKLTEDQKQAIAAVDAARKKIRDRLDALRDEARKPLTDWESAEDARAERIKETLSALRNHGMTGMETPDAIRYAAECIKAIVIGDDFGGALGLATDAKAASLDGLRTMYAAAVRRDKDAADLAELRAAADARAEADRVRDEADRVAADAARVAKEQAERAAFDRNAAEKAATARAVQIEADKRAAVEAAKVEAARQLADMAARHQRAIDGAAQAERDRIAAQSKVEADARAKREADATHRASITRDIADALRTMIGKSTPELIAEALIEGRIPHCKVSM
jgi:hypothetical protein